MRRPLDAYYTPEGATRDLLSRVDIRGFICEPCSGNDDITRVFDGYDGAKPVNPIITNDIDLNVPSFLHFPAQELKLNNIDWFVSNPPFNESFDIITNLYPQAKLGLAMLLRLSFLEPTYERGEWLSEHNPDLVLVLPRISFTGDGKTDSVTCAWIVWYKDIYEKMDQLRGIHIVPKKPRAKNKNGQLQQAHDLVRKVANITE